MPLTVASWNIEKTGLSSQNDKKARVDTFIHRCVQNTCQVIFLCEVHSAQVENYASFLSETYSTQLYNIISLPGGYSNAYIAMVHNSAGLTPSEQDMNRLNRGYLLLQHKQNDDIIYSLLLAHFKSGQTVQTKTQLEQTSNWLNTSSTVTGKWAITGDMNWDLKKCDELTLPTGTQCIPRWGDNPTQVKGGILDWCMAGGNTVVECWGDDEHIFDDLLSMNGPDHRPVAFTLHF